jgi:hypothetical protein
MKVFIRKWHSMEKPIYNIYPADLPELIEAMQAGKYKHLSIFLYRDKSSLDMGFGQQYLLVSNSGFGLYELKSVDYNSGFLQMLFTNPDTGCFAEVNLDVNNEHPEHFAIRWNDLKDMVYNGIASDYDDADLLELENE